MLFNSLGFALFFPLVFVVYRVLPHRWQNRLLLVASYFFYGCWDWRFLSLLALSTAIDFACGRWIHAATDPRRRRGLLLLSLASNLGLLGVFKYFDFFAASLVDLLSAFGLDVGPVVLHIVLPVGISFYTFQTLSYTIDIYRGTLEPTPSLVDFALFVSFFPQLVAGPIERAADLLPQVRRPRRTTTDGFERGMWLVLWGFVLKVFVADNLGPIADRVFDGHGPVEGLAALLAVYAFAFQIFGDFAGYSSIAIGIAAMMGFELTTNFRQPYLVTNPRDFWRHWHITLSTWLRDYLYVPLGGNRGSSFRTYRNLSLTMLLGGLWHGAAWTFVAWGAYQGALLIGHRLIEERWPTRRPDGRLAWAVKVVAMFHLTCIGWLLFRAPSLGRFHEMLVAILTNLGAPSDQDVMTALRLAFFASLVLVIQAVDLRGGRSAGFDRLPGGARVALALVMLYALLVWGNYGGAPFIYFQF